MRRVDADHRRRAGRPVGVAAIEPAERAGDVDRAAGRVGQRRHGHVEDQRHRPPRRRRLDFVGVAGAVEGRVHGPDDVEVGRVFDHVRVGEGRRRRFADLGVWPAGRGAAQHFVEVRVAHGVPNQGDALRRSRVNRQVQRRGRGRRVGVGRHGHVAGVVVLVARRLRRIPAVHIAIDPRRPAVGAEAHQVVVCAGRLRDHLALVLVVVTVGHVEAHRPPVRPAGRVAAVRPEANPGQDAIRVAARVGHAGHVDAAVDHLRAAGAHREGHVRRPLENGIGDGEEGRGRGLVARRPLVAGGVNRADDVEVLAAVLYRHVGVGRGRGVADQDVAAAGDGAAIDVVGRRPAGGDVPVEHHLAVAGLGGQVGRRARRHEVLAAVGHQDGRALGRQLDGDDAARGGDRPRQRAQLVGQNDGVGQMAGGGDDQRLRRAVAVDGHDGGLGIGAHQIGHRPRRVIGQQEGHLALAEDLVAVAQAGQQLVVGQHVGVAAGLVAVPGEDPPVVRVVVAGHGDFVAVVDGRRAGRGHLHHSGQLQHRLALGQVGGVELALLAVARAGRQQPEDALRVVATHEVHHGVVAGVGVVFADGDELAGKERRRLVGLAIVHEALVIDAAEEAEDGIAEAVAHRRIGLVAAHLGQNLELLPQLADDRRVGVDGLDVDAELLPEAGREAAVAHHVEPPAGRAAVEPGVIDRVRPGIEQVAHALDVLVQHG